MIFFFASGLADDTVILSMSVARRTGAWVTRALSIRGRSDGSDQSISPWTAHGNSTA
jgi:hypothetical protein